MIGALKVEVYLKQEMKCSDCDKTIPGMVQRFNYSGAPEGLPAFLEAIPKSACDMPIGWASRYSIAGTVFKCEEHK